MFISDALAVEMALHGYSLLRLLGKGGAGAVFEARQISTGQTVAIKLLHQDSADSDALRKQRLAERFERETHLCAQLHHPHIVRLLDKGQTSAGDQGNAQQLFAVFEYVPGESLKDLLIRDGALSALVAGELMGQVLDALVAAHAKGIVHRDLKPQNVMIMRTGARLNVKVLDFGIAAFIPERQMADYRNLTITQETMCSPSYSAPEQLRGEPPTLKTDLYAWGLLFLECLTGRPAIQGFTLAEIFHKQLSTEEVPIPAGLVGHPLADLLRRVLRKSPHERAGRAAVLYEDFQQINLANIVGDLHTHLHDLSEVRGSDDSMGSLTQPSASGWFGMADDRQQITVLSCTLVVSVLVPGQTEPDALEALQRDQLTQCIDTAMRYGGHLAGSMGNSLMFYYGYPQVADTDARRCARSALELVSQVRRRSALLAQQHGCSMVIRSAIHTGIVRARQACLPAGLTPNIALQLAHRAEAGAVLVSASARKILEQFMQFQDGGECIIEGSGETLPYALLVGEYSAEAASFLRSGNSGRTLIGRTQEFATLNQAWDASQNGQGGALLIQGEAGIGKSRLSYELGLVARAQNGITKECRCLPEYQNNALFPILTMLKSHWQLHLTDDAVARLHRALQEARCAVEAVLPILCSWLALPIPDSYPVLQFSPERQKKMLLDAVQSLILHIGHAQPLLLVIEDMHWIDQTSVELLSQIMPALAQQAVLLLMTARPGFSVPWDAGQVRLQQVERLAEQDAEQLISNIIGGKPIAPAALRRLCERTDGIPLFAEELTRMLQEDRLLVERQGVFHLDERFDSTDIPVTLRDLLSARLARLGAARESAQLASAIGREFDYNLLACVSLADEATLQNDLEQMLAAGLIYRQRRVHGDSYIFHHALLRDAAYDAMPKKVREQTHERIAQQLESRSEAEIERDLPQLARHFALATRFASAVKYGTRAAQISLERALTDDAIIQAEMVQSWVGQLAHNEQDTAALAINPTYTNALMLKYGWSDTRVALSADQALRLIDRVDDVQLAAPAIWAAAFYHHFSSHRPTVRTLANQLFVLAEQSNDKMLRVACNMLHADACWLDGDTGLALQSLHQVLADYDAVSHSQKGYLFTFDFRVWATGLMAEIQWFCDTDDAAVFALAHQALAHARALNHVSSIGVALMYSACVHQYAGDRTGVSLYATEMLALAQQYGLHSFESYGTVLQSWANSDLVPIDQLLEGMRTIGCLLGTTHLGALAADIEAHAGRHEAALERIDACVALCGEIGEQWYKPELLRRRAIYRAQTRFADPALSREDLLQALLLAEGAGMKRTILNIKAGFSVVGCDLQGHFGMGSNIQ